MGDLAEPSDVGAGLEVLAGATNDETAHRGVGAETGQTLDQPVQHGGVVGIPDLRPIEGDGGNATVVSRKQHG